MNQPEWIQSSFVEQLDSHAVRQRSIGSPEYLALLDALLLIDVPHCIEEMRDLHFRKNAGYAGHSDDPWVNFRKCERFGIPIDHGVLTRMSDKWSRLESLAQDMRNEKVGETFEDTLRDLAAYALILVCLRQEQKEQST